MKQIVKITLFAFISALSIYTTSSALPELSTRAAFETAINKNELVIIDFYMPSCGPCKRIAPLLEELSQQFPGVKIFKVDITKKELDSLAHIYNIRSVPCLVFMKNGSEAGRHKGGNVTKDQLADKITQFFSL